jgi:SAM-dependent methyltransferase
MFATTLEVLRRRLSPRAFDRTWLAWWIGRWYIPRLALAPFHRRTAAVECFPAGNRPSELASRIARVNLAAPTPLCRIMTGFGSDKGRDTHNYTTVYSALLGPVRRRPLRVFELGLGTNNPDFKFNMGKFGRPGASLRGWRKFIPKARVYGADIDRGVLFREDSIETFYCDQLDAASIRELWSQPALHEGMDLIVDDGLHTFEGNTSFLNGSLDHLRPGGFYIVEDLNGETLANWRDVLENGYSRQFSEFEFVLAQLPNPYNSVDNNLVVVHRPE